MKKVVKIFIILAVFGVIGAIFLVLKKKKQDAKDREILNGMTGKEFLERIRPAWKNKFISSQISWLKNQPEYSKSYIVENNPDFTSVMDANLQKYIDETTRGSAEGSWSQLKPNPMDFDWSRLYWLPQEIDKMGLNINHERVQELIRKI